MRGSQPRLQLGGVPVMRSGSVGWGWGGPVGTTTGWFGGDLLLWVGLEVSGGKAKNDKIPEHPELEGTVHAGAGLAAPIIPVLAPSSLLLCSGHLP